MQSLETNAAAENSPKRPLWKKLLLIPAGLLAGILFGLAAIWIWDALRPGPSSATDADTLALRIMLDGDRSSRGLYLYDEPLGYRFKPDYEGIRHETSQAVHRTNSLGLLGEEIPLDAKPRAVFLGDSVTYGNGVSLDATFVSRLDQIAAAELACWNGSCPGWNMRQELAFFDAYLNQEAWDLVVVSVCLNDFVDFGWLHVGDKRFRWGIRESVSTFERVGLFYSKFQMNRRSETVPLSKHDDATMLAWSGGRIQRHLKSQLMPFCNRHDDLNIVVLVLPTQCQIDAISREADPALAFRPQRVIRDFCKRNNIGFVDAWLVMNEHGVSPAEGLNLYLENDVLHFNPEGHKTLALALWPKIRNLVSFPSAQN